MLREHLICDGICKNYIVWIWHDERLENYSGTFQYVKVDHNLDDEVDMDEY